MALRAGDEVAELLTALDQGDVSCFLSLEPHLASAGQFRGFSGPDLFRQASKALKTILADIGASWD